MLVAVHAYTQLVHYTSIHGTVVVAHLSSVYAFVLMHNTQYVVLEVSDTLLNTSQHPQVGFY